MANNADNILIGSATVSVNGIEIGYTQGGTTVAYDTEFVDVDADQANGIVRKGRSMERMYVRFNLLEVSLDQMRIAMMLPTVNLSGSVLTLGYNDACWVAENVISLVGPGPSCGTRTFSLPKAVSFGSKEYGMTRDSATMYAVEMEVLKDTSGNFGTITDS